MIPTLKRLALTFLLYLQNFKEDHSKKSSEFKIDESLRLSLTLNLDRIVADDHCLGYHILLHSCTLPQGHLYTESISNNLTIHCHS